LKTITFYSTLFFLLCSLPNNAQQLDHVQGEILVQANSKTAIDQLLAQYRIFHGNATHLKIKYLVSSPLQIWLLSFNHQLIHERNLLAHIKGNPSINTAQFNHLIQNRNQPNDPLYSDQWQYINVGENGGIENADLDADLAWDITTGGLSPLGDSIVVAVLDDGILLEHPDFGNNLWVNYHEVPNNGVDDDENGYVDDYRGWNIQLDNDYIQGGGDHGVPVAGIIGAKGNNEIGVTGVNWNCQLMIVKNNGNTNEAEVLEAYTYPLMLRRQYNESNGSKGAFVVATNSSWGADLGQASEAPLWCEVYDLLGMEGILNCAATTNEDINVDEMGDMPTTCPSDFLLTVTNLKRNDEKKTQAGYGVEHIDIGAYGSETYTTLENEYGPFEGTSAAVPHVAGAVALLYSTLCSSLSQIAKNNPSQAALLAKQFILEGSVPNESLEEITQSGGRLHLHNSVQMALADCGDCILPGFLEARNITASKAELFWQEDHNATATQFRWRVIGSATWNTINDVNSPIVLDDLSLCTTYEFQLASSCENQSSGFCNPVLFSTIDCCNTPPDLNINGITPSELAVVWPEIPMVDTYEIRLRVVNTSAWTNQTVTGEAANFSNLLPCSNYEIQIRNNCNNTIGAYSPSLFFQTIGCGFCLESDYCFSLAEDANFEWIQRVQINTINNLSGSDGGYGDYLDFSTTLKATETYEISLTPGFESDLLNEYFRVWIDYNRDEVFDEVNELAFDANQTTQETLIGMISIPENIVAGAARMRVSMKWIGPGDGGLPGACMNSFDFGEVEDYCVQLISDAPLPCDLPNNLVVSEINNTSAIIEWEDPTDDHFSHNLRFRETTTNDWDLIQNIESPYLLSDLSFCKAYEVQVEANCVSEGTSNFTNAIFFTSNCNVSVDSGDTKISDWLIRPNPFREYLTLEFNVNRSVNLSFQLYSASGQKAGPLCRETLKVGEHQILFDQYQDFPSGLYFLRVTSGNSLIKLVELLKL